MAVSLVEGGFHKENIEENEHQRKQIACGDSMELVNGSGQQSSDCGDDVVDVEDAVVVHRVAKWLV